MAGIKDVAAKAGVSISTVSYVMSGKRSIGEDTKRKVLQAAREVGYAKARDLRLMPSGRTKVLALSSPVHDYTDYSNYSIFFLSLATRAKRHGYDILLLMHEYGDAELTRVVDNGMVDGILLLDVLMVDARAEVAKTLDVPVVAVGYPSNSEAIYSVDLDFERMGREAVERLHALGHRMVLIVGSKSFAYEDGSNFLVRFRDAAAKRGADLGMEVLFKPSTGYAAADVELLLDEAFGEHPDLTAIVCQTNTAHVQNMMAALRRRGLSVPADVSVMAACTYGVAQMTNPVDEMPMQPNETCARAVDLMVEVLEGRRSDAGHVELMPVEYRAWGTVGARKTSLQ